jgi:hypothetical protein
VAKAFVGSNPTPRTIERISEAAFLYKTSKKQWDNALTSQAARTTLSLALFALLVFGMLTVEANAASVNVTVNHNSVSVNLDLALEENLTQNIPLVDFVVDSSNSTGNIYTALVQPFQQAITEQLPAARVDDFAATVRSDVVDAAEGLLLLQENYSLTVSGIIANPGSMEAVDLSFLSLNVSSPIFVGGIELNNFVPNYLAPALEAANSTLTKPGFFINGEGPSGAAIPLVTTLHFHLLDFNWILPATAWSGQRQTFDNSTVWTLNPANSQYNLTVGEIPTPEDTFERVLMAVYSPNVQVSAPAGAWLDGNSVMFDLPSPTDYIMPVIIAASLILLAVTILLDRRLTRTIRTRRKK